jgi:hypothetical protein
MSPLTILARLTGPIMLPGGPLAIDGLLAYWVAVRDRLLPATSAAEAVDIEIPVAREPGGRFHLASFSIGQVEAVEGDHLNKRFPVDRWQSLGQPGMRALRLSAGPAKSYRIPAELYHLRNDELRWFVVGNQQEIRDLLGMCGHLGKKRSTGNGRVREWVVAPCDPWGPDFPVALGGQPLRPLPLDWPGVSPDANVAHRTLTYPYWANERRQLCYVPGGMST